MVLEHITNLSLLNKLTRVRIVFLTLVFPFLFRSQITNYVSNGGFEQAYDCNWPNAISKAKYWLAIDSSSFAGLYMSSCPNYGLVPLNGFTYQFPKHGSAYALTTFFCTTANCMSNNGRRGYLKNRLKTTLQPNKIYCVKFYANICNSSSHGLDGFGAYFGNSTIDTITKCTIPLNFINPQVQNTNYNIVTDTLNWTLITGTFVATGAEKYLLLGNFKSDTATHVQVSNSNFLPGIYTDVAIDDVSCIPLNLPAFAGSDIWAIPGSTVYIGRQQDVGIDEACMWYKLPNTTTAIDTAAGITLTVAATTETYVVKQDICGVIKYDTVVVHQSAVELVTLSGVEEGEVTISPNPAQDFIELKMINEELKMNSCTLLIYNSVGQLLREEEIIFKNNVATVNVSELSNGVYLLSIRTKENRVLNKRIVISR